MSTRSRTKSGLSGKPSSAHAKKGHANSQTGYHDDMDVDSQGNDHESTKISSKVSKRTNQSKVKGNLGGRRGTLQPIDCICTKGNDGSPMIHCADCRIWCVKKAELWLFFTSKP